ncbi:hypothetical protein G647_03815 [Cladophialophora carrionii CBS 160.54]|uniref:Uncharacterized protein n=1 Tax=Cladophialophora carrionii CBS 160.54 TaxID=1279043 RepID=V9DCP3_9EURO|nr:uncharacterized protein G647_03815 [Cladophialophora carrionii CBS 160.54]ETI24446.1 hypothetical protein G647_03815 [Cladophialophora carrionii CBS 160.54]
MRGCSTRSVQHCREFQHRFACSTADTDLSELGHLDAMQILREQVAAHQVAGCCRTSCCPHGRRRVWPHICTQTRKK